MRGKKKSTKSWEGNKGPESGQSLGRGYNQNVMYEMYKELTKMLLKILIKEKWMKILCNSQKSKWKQKSSYYKWNNPDTELKKWHIFIHMQNLILTLIPHQAPMDGANQWPHRALAQVKRLQY